MKPAAPATAAGAAFPDWDNRAEDSIRLSCCRLPVPSAQGFRPLLVFFPLVALRPGTWFQAQWFLL